MVIVISYNGAVSSPDKQPSGTCGNFAAAMTPVDCGAVTLKIDGVVMAVNDSIPKTARVLEVVSVPELDSQDVGPLWQAMAAADGEQP